MTERASTVMVGQHLLSEIMYIRCWALRVRASQFESVYLAVSEAIHIVVREHGDRPVANDALLQVVTAMRDVLSALEAREKDL